MVAHNLNPRQREANLEKGSLKDRNLLLFAVLEKPKPVLISVEQEMEYYGIPTIYV